MNNVTEEKILSVVSLLRAIENESCWCWGWNKENAKKRAEMAKKLYNLCAEISNELNYDELNYEYDAYEEELVMRFPQTIGSTTYYSKEELFMWVKHHQKIKERCIEALLNVNS